ncbi:hypothetical protein GOEFS_076_00170 [Gordonia effusa NBRC 100432]|uniref:DUF4878 domain-containing protein n=1 Tax=Gordonia effusa NBRC 100432 TaxID=1077974 RepID=H0R287_9ACTN|nr:hypothetical protein [Gordonia effusa]GAB19188.1 hypothetical protein GOEFS_076_00170 [Gordonia effusa NBRC 100432]
MAQTADDQSPRTGNIWPFAAAVIVIVLAVGGVLLSNVLRPSDDRVSDSAQVQYAINDSYTARNSLDYAKYRSTMCADVVDAADFPTEQVFVEENRRSRETFGKILIPEIADVMIDGNRATAQVHWHFENKGSDAKTVTPTTVVREGDEWKVCK